MRKNEQFSFRCAPEEVASWKGAAKLKHLHTAEWVRGVLNEAAVLVAAGPAGGDGLVTLPISPVRIDTTSPDKTRQVVLTPAFRDEALEEMRTQVPGPSRVIPPSNDTPNPGSSESEIEVESVLGGYACLWQGVRLDLMERSQKSDEKRIVREWGSDALKVVKAKIAGGAW